MIPAPSSRIDPRDDDPGLIMIVIIMLVALLFITAMVVMRGLDRWRKSVALRTHEEPASAGVQ